MSLGASLFAVLALLVTNAFFVAAEFALVRARGVRVEELAREGDALARRVSHIQDHIEPYLAACQLGITMASLGLGWVGEPAVAALLEPGLRALGFEAHVHTISFIAGFLVFSSLHIVVGEQVPKTFALRESVTVSRLCAIPLQGFYWLCYPLNWLLNWASQTILAKLSVRAHGAEDPLSIRELSSLVDQSATSGDLPEQQATLLRNVFLFDERPVKSIMIPRQQIDYLDIGWDAAAVEAVVRRTQHSRLPLLDGGWDQPLGFVLVRDLFTHVLDAGPGGLADLRDRIRDPLVIPEAQSVAALFDAMRTSRAHLSFVTNEYGELAGIVSLEDLLEEIVGEIDDELDEPATICIRPTSEGWEAHGLVPLTDLHRTVGMPLFVDSGVNTLSGLVTHTLHRLPQAGDELVLGGFRVRVDAVRDRRIEQASIVRLSAAELTAAEAAQSEAASANTPPSA